MNEDTGLLLPANSYSAFPFTDPDDEDVPFAVTELNYTQYFSEHFGAQLGKAMWFDEVRQKVVMFGGQSVTCGFPPGRHDSSARLSEPIPVRRRQPCGAAPRRQILETTSAR